MLVVITMGSIQKIVVDLVSFSSEEKSLLYNGISIKPPPRGKHSTYKTNNNTCKNFFNHNISIKKL